MLISAGKPEALSKHTGEEKTKKRVMPLSQFTPEFYLGAGIWPSIIAKATRLLQIHNRFDSCWPPL